MTRSDAIHAASAAPIGVFDSGIGGLSVLRALRAELPQESFVYLADTGFAPYGERGDAFVRARTEAITAWLKAEHHIKALVVACNTATAAAIHDLRERYPGFPIIGVEPALKPAVAATRTGRIGVLATRGTVASAKFARLLANLQAQAEFIVQPCAGLARAIEHSVEPGVPGTQSRAEVEALCARYLDAMRPFGTQPGAVDTLVLGCTHYVFAEAVLRQLAGPAVRLIETGMPVARHTRRLLAQADALAAHAPADVHLLTTGHPQWLQAAATRWLKAGAPRSATRVHIPNPGQAAAPHLAASALLHGST
jgi:glutamate racemase